MFDVAFLWLPCEWAGSRWYVAVRRAGCTPPVMVSSRVLLLSGGQMVDWEPVGAACGCEPQFGILPR